MNPEWEPGHFDKDPMVNAILNVARELSTVGPAIEGLLYALKYSKKEGLSVAEAVEKGLETAGERIAEAIETHGTDVESAE